MQTDPVATDSPDRLAELWLLGDYVTPLVLRSVSQLGVADHLAEGPRPVAHLAKLVGADVDALRRSMRLLVAKGVFEEPAPDQFALTSLSEPLRTDHPESARQTLSLLPCDLHAWAEVQHSLRTGEPAFPEVYQTDRWSYLAANPSDEHQFHERMRSASRRVGKALATGYPWRGDEHVIDVGGGTGGVLAELLAAYPQMTGCLFDQPQVAPLAGPVLDQFGARCQVVGGDFFEDVPAGAGIYLLVNAAHDWPDERAAVILSRVRHRMADGARLLIVEGVPGVNGQPSRSGALDLHLLVVWGGRERGLADWRSLLGAAGLQISRTLPAGPRWVVECVPVPS